MPDKLIRKALEEVLDSSAIFERKKRTLINFEQFYDEDINFLKEINAGKICEFRIEEIARTVGKRFGKLMDRPCQIGSTGTLQFRVDPHINGKLLRFKGFNKPIRASQDLQHALFLNEMGESGYNAIVGCGPNAHEVLYIFMVNYPKSAGSMLRADIFTYNKRMPKTLREILDLFGQYALSKQHLEGSAYIPNHIELVRTRLLDAISKENGKLKRAEQRWTEEINKAIDYIKKDIYKGNEQSTWILCDATIDNILAIDDGNRNPFWVFADQGNYPDLLKHWRSNTHVKDVNAQYYGRVEFNLGQLVHSALRSENIPPLDTEFEQVFYELVHDSKLVGKTSSRHMPEPHNPALSYAFYYLGALNQQILDMAYATGEGCCVNGALKFIERIMNANKYVASDVRANGRAFRITREDVGARKAQYS